ncbi:MAG: NAD(+)/NADH kinase [Promethearchaeota archaeon]
MQIRELIGTEKAIGIASRLDSGKAIAITKDLINFFVNNKVKVYPEARIANLVSAGVFGKPLNEMNRFEVPLVISVGGDGTILRVAQNLPFKNPSAILGINVGAVGFLAEFDLTGKEPFEEILSTDLKEERCMRLSTHIEKTERLPLALNEVLIITSRPSKALSITIRVDGQEFSSGYVDGILVCTPTGSTAYSLSAGGSIMVPELDAIQIVPVCPFARTGLKPLVIGTESVVEIELLRPKLNAIVAIDGQREYTIMPSNNITIRKSTNYIRCLRSPNLKKSFFSRLNNKLLPGARFPVPRHDSPEE